MTLCCHHNDLFKLVKKGCSLLSGQPSIPWKSDMIFFKFRRNAFTLGSKYSILSCIQFNSPELSLPFRIGRASFDYHCQNCTFAWSISSLGGIASIPLEATSKRQRYLVFWACTSGIRKGSCERDRGLDNLVQGDLESLSMHDNARTGWHDLWGDLQTDVPQLQMPSELSSLRETELTKATRRHTNGID